jgi:hypothetical protein
LYQATSAGPFGTSIAPSDVRPTDSTVASILILGILIRSGIPELNFMPPMFLWLLIQL